MNDGPEDLDNGAVSDPAPVLEGPSTEILGDENDFGDPFADPSTVDVDEAPEPAAAEPAFTLEANPPARTFTQLELDNAYETAAHVAHEAVRKFDDLSGRRQAPPWGIAPQSLRDQSVARVREFAESGDEIESPEDREQRLFLIVAAGVLDAIGIEL